ncbi:MAG TPA: FG-GAP-like repeat-containing protein, partial [Cyclobacteriaceae bacterium]
NQSAERKVTFLTVDLIKNNPTQQIIGTKLIAYQDKQSQYFEFFPARGFQSAMYVPITIGLRGKEQIDSLRIIWPDAKTQLLTNIKADLILTPEYPKATSVYSYAVPKEKTFFESVSSIDWKHSPVDTVDFKRQLLLPKMFSYSGPRIAKGDVNGDGLEDIYLCGPRHQAGALFMQKKEGDFQFVRNHAFNVDKESQDEDAVFFDSDADGDLDLYVVSGGYLFSKDSPLLQDRLYINDGKGNFNKSTSALPVEAAAGSCVAVLDVNGDGKSDLFIGGAFIPGEYPLSSGSALLISDGKGHFEKADNVEEIKSLSRVTDVKVVDLNNDKQQDLLVSLEWASIKVLINAKGVLVDKTTDWFPKQQEGWWSRLLAEDFDGDGDIDLIAGNYGLNGQFKSDSLHPATLVYKDFNKDGQIDPFFSYYIGDTAYPYASRDEALGQVGMLRPRFPDYTTYSSATLETIFKKEELEGTENLQAYQLQSTYFESRNGKFVSHELPTQAQFAPVYAMVALDVDQDGDQDIILGGNDNQARVRIGKTDANKGILLLNDGKGNFTYVPQFICGLNFSGDVRDLITVSGAKGIKLITGTNGEKVLTHQLSAK